MMFRLFCCIAVVTTIGLAVMPSVGLADDLAFCPSGSSGDWGTLANWDEGSTCGGTPASALPTENDRAYIPDGKICNVNVTDAEADRIVLTQGAELNIQAGKRLTLDGDGGNSVIADVITLEGADSELGFVDNDQDLAATEAGIIVGEHDDAKISIAEDVTLTSELFLIEGHLKIVGLGIFENNGFVTANAAGTLQINTQFIDDAAHVLFFPTWKVSSNAGAVLEFNPTSVTTQTLVGHTEVNDGGKLKLSKSLLIDGRIKVTTGQIEAATGVGVFYSYDPPD